MLGSDSRKMSVRTRRDIAVDVVEVELVPGDGLPCPAWEPGAHVDVVLPSGVVRQYSISGGDGESIKVAVLRQEDGRGGSVELHDALSEGVVAEIRGPRNHFRLIEVDEYVFVAGGIGITPILAMIRHAEECRSRWTLVYGGRTRGSMAYLPELEELVGSAGDRAALRLVPQDEDGLLDIPAVFEAGNASVPVYACGPEPLLAALESHAEACSAVDRLHLERFGAAPVDLDADDGARDHFEIELASSGIVLPVGPDDRVIDVVRTQVPGMPFSCEEGYCGSCETGVLAGLPCHRDQLLSAEEHDANDVMMICVGRAKSDRLVLDL
ncbi:PDR/VanB family oxidoreductase [Nocardioides hungaricus]